MNRQRQIMFEQIGAKVAYYRRLTGFSQEELAGKIHVNKSVLSRIERGKYNDNIPLILLFDIADIMQVDVATFITFTDFERRFWNTERGKEYSQYFQDFLFYYFKCILRRKYMWESIVNAFYIIYGIGAAIFAVGFTYKCFKEYNGGSDGWLIALGFYLSLGFFVACIPLAILVTICEWIFG